MAKSTWIRCPGIFLSRNVHNTSSIVNMYCTSMFWYLFKLFYEGYNPLLDAVLLQFQSTDHWASRSHACVWIMCSGKKRGDWACIYAETWVQNPPSGCEWGQVQILGDFGNIDMPFIAQQLSQRDSIRDVFFKKKIAVNNQRLVASSEVIALVSM